MKKAKDICIVVQARLNSQRVPQKMIKPFCGTTLLDILFTKLSRVKSINKTQIFVSAYEPEVKEIAAKYGLNVFDRSEASANEETDIKTIFEWHNKLDFKYIVMVSACNPLLKESTIDRFIEQFIASRKEGAFAVFEKKTYYWDANGNNLTDWKGLKGMNTKMVDPVLEAAHCLYASRMDIIGEGYWLDKNSPMDLELVTMEELEAFDIDYQWQFDVAEVLFYNSVV